MALVTPEYEAVLKTTHEGNPKWGSSTEKYGTGDIIGIVHKYPYIQTVLDYGCGKGALAEYLAAKAPEIEVTSYDPGIRGKDVLPKGKFDLVITCDVLEHVEPHLIDENIAYLWSMTKVVMYNNIACSSARHNFTDGPYAGEDLHLIQEAPGLWRERFDRVLTDPKCSLMEYRDIQRRHNTGWRKRCVMIHERVG